MKLLSKSFLLIGISILVLGSCSTFAAGGKNKPVSTIQKSGTKLPCELTTGFADKIALIKKNSTQKITILNQLNTSLQQIIPLVKSTTIKNSLQTKQKGVVVMIKNYTALKAILEKNPKSACGQKMPVWRTYNEETKVLVEGIRAQFRLLKK